MLRSVVDQKEDIPRSWPSFGRTSIIRIFSQKISALSFPEERRKVKNAEQLSVGLCMSKSRVCFKP